MAELLPTVTLYKGHDATIVFVGPGTSTFNFSSYTSAGLHSSDLSLTKPTTDSAKAVITNSGADLTVYIEDTDLTSVTAGDYEYHLYVVSSTRSLDVAGHGVLRVLEDP